MIEVPDDLYVDYVQLRRERDARRAAPAPTPIARDSWWTKFFIVAVLLILGVLTADHFKMIPQTWIDAVLGKEQTTLGTTPTVPSPTPFTARQPAAQPISGGNAAQPAPTPTPDIACANGGIWADGRPRPLLGSCGAGQWPGASNTAAIIPTPTAQFWAPEELTAFSLTATAFIEAVATAPPAFIQYTEAQCADPEVVAQSVTLQLFCKR